MTDAPRARAGTACIDDLALPTDLLSGQEFGN